MTIGQIQEETTHRRVVNALKMHPLIKSIAGDDLLGATSQSGVWVFGNVEATNLDGKVALKVVVPQSEQEIAKREDEVKRVYEFYRKLPSSPHVLPLLGEYLRCERTSTLPPFFGIFMEQAECDFGRIITKEKHAEEESLEMIVQAGRGLSVIHGKGLHRDIKPNNLLRMRDGRIVVADFEQVLDLNEKRPLTSQAKSTTSFQSPELFCSRKWLPNNASNDIYALGACLYAALIRNEQPPLYYDYMKQGGSKTTPERYQRFIYEAIDALDVSEVMRHYLMRLMGWPQQERRPRWMKRDWEYMYQSINAFIRDAEHRSKIQVKTYAPPEKPKPEVLSQPSTVDSSNFFVPPRTLDELLGASIPLRTIALPFVSEPENAQPRKQSSREDRLQQASAVRLGESEPTHLLPFSPLDDSEMYFSLETGPNTLESKPIQESYTASEPPAHAKLIKFRKRRDLIPKAIIVSAGVIGIGFSTLLYLKPSLFFQMETPVVIQQSARSQQEESIESRVTEQTPLQYALPQTTSQHIVQPEPAPQIAPTQQSIDTVAEPRSEIANSTGMRLRLIPAGRFTMGIDVGNARPQHVVNLDAFYMGTTEVTVRQYKEYIEDTRHRIPVNSLSDTNTPWDGQLQHLDYPVVNVSWVDATGFCQWLTGIERRGTYSLPSEAQWEYACRAGTTAAYNFGRTLTDARFGQRPGTGVSTVGGFPSNPFGLHDMHGNVWEWCLDWYHPNYNGAPDDGSAWLRPSMDDRVIRGGGWDSPARDCTSSTRDYIPADSRGNGAGFRVVRSLEE